MHTEEGIRFPLEAFDRRLRWDIYWIRVIRLEDEIWPTSPFRLLVGYTSYLRCIVLGGYFLSLHISLYLYIARKGF